MCGEVCLRACQDVRPGTELLLDGDASDKGQAADEQGAAAGHKGEEKVCVH